ncbi:hypothetical protein OOT46_23045 [Aquabacterium sp. A7-Y]|uniref:hypothetical protein n=1 Tax=Aquabacterium sp. A7-Y TaxID=1349605 RepID=UPI00223CACDF|nr:hypothetical protein [Aquabacterium sp. A7-Y]MCW7540700.1 hypothetical protein [Aquabacterium sp. A7-Y]
MLTNLQPALSYRFTAQYRVAKSVVLVGAAEADVLRGPDAYSRIAARRGVQQSSSRRFNPQAAVAASQICDETMPKPTGESESSAELKQGRMSSSTTAPRQAKRGVIRVAKAMHESGIGAKQIRVYLINNGVHLALTDVIALLDNDPVLGRIKPAEARLQKVAVLNDAGKRDVAELHETVRPTKYYRVAEIQFYYQLRSTGQKTPCAGAPEGAFDKLRQWTEERHWHLEGAAKPELFDALPAAVVTGDRQPVSEPR